MKKIHLYFITLLLTIVAIDCFSQDMIIKTNGDEIEVKIVEINTTEIKYKKYSLPEGPLYVILKSEVFMIKYSNGEKELINKKEDKVKPDTTGTKVSTVKVTYSSIGKKNNDIPEFWGALKLSPFLSLVGEYPLYFEYVLKKKSSVEVGLGATYPNSFMLGIYNFAAFNLEDREKHIGYSVSANYRLYPEIVFDEFYFGLDFRYKSYLTKLTNCSGSIIPAKDESFSYLDFKLLVGYTTDLSSSALAEFFVAFGLRSITWNYFYCQNSSLAIIENIIEKNTAPTISFGIKLGLGLEREEIPTK